MLVLHRDDIGSHNALANLRYGTHQDNHDDMKASGRMVRGEAYRSAKLTDRTAAAALALKGIVSQSEIATLARVSTSAIQAVHDRRTWTHVTATSVAQARQEFGIA